MTQLALPVDIAPHEIARKSTLGGAIELCAEAGGLEPKEIQLELKLDKAQWSRWTSGQEGIVWPKFRALMDYCGNNAPVLWMAHDRGYDIGRMHKRESELEQKLRLAEERLQRIEAERAIEKRLMHDMMLGRGMGEAVRV